MQKKVELKRKDGSETDWKGKKVAKVEKKCGRKAYSWQK